jgi:hypothetical protein
MFRNNAPILLLLFLLLALLNACSTDYNSVTRSSEYAVEGGVAEDNRWRDNRYFASAVETEALDDDGIHDPRTMLFTPCKSLPKPLAPSSGSARSRRLG